jgi:hypothetical protein
VATSRTHTYAPNACAVCKRGSDLACTLKRVIRATLAGALAAVVFIATPAHADTLRQRTLLVLDNEYAPQPYQRWVDRASVATPLASVRLHLTRCADAAACASPEEQAIWVDPSERRWDRRVMLLHELGHLYDAVMPEWKRARFQVIMGLTGSWEGAPASGWGPGPPIEQFAQGYALCALAGARRDRIREWDSVYGYWPSRSQHRRVCALLR